MGDVVYGAGWTRGSSRGLSREHCPFQPYPRSRESGVQEGPRTTEGSPWEADGMQVGKDALVENKGGENGGGGGSRLQIGI